MKAKTAKSGEKNKAAKQPAPTPDAAPSPVAVRPPPAIVEPPFSCKIMWVKGVVRVIVNLQRCSEKCINFTPTSDRFYLDTFKHTKKYKLDFIYPEGVRVDASAPEATLEAGILKTDLKVVDWAGAASQHAEIVSHHQGMLKSRGIKGVDEVDGKQTSQKSAPVQESTLSDKAESQTQPSNAAASSGKASTPKRSQKTQAPKLAPQPRAVTQQGSDRVKSKPQTALKHKPASQLTPASSDAESDQALPKPKKKKKFLEKNEMSEMLGKIVKAAEIKSEVRLHRDEEESSHVHEVIQSKQEKQESRKKRKQEARAILHKAIKRKKIKSGSGTADSGKKVMFSP